MEIKFKEAIDKQNMAEVKQIVCSGFQINENYQVFACKYSDYIKGESSNRTFKASPLFYAIDCKNYPVVDFLLHLPTVNFTLKSEIGLTIEDSTLIKGEKFYTESLLSRLCPKRVNTSSKQRKKICICIGYTYDDGMCTLFDLNTVSNTLKSFGYTIVVMKNLSKQDIFAKLLDISKEIEYQGENFQIFLYVSAHGCCIDKIDYFVCGKELINVNSLFNFLSKIDFLHLILFVDACRVEHSETQVKEDKRQRLSYGSVVNVIQTCSMYEYSYITDEGSMVTNAFLSVLKKDKSIHELFKEMIDRLGVQNVQKYCISPTFFDEGTGTIKF